MSPVYGRKTVIGWALYDWANSAFSLTVVTVFFPILLSGYWNDDAASVVTTFRLGWTNAGASLIVALFAPVLGVMADGRGSRKHMVALFAAVGISMTAALFWVAIQWSKPWASGCGWSLLLNLPLRCHFPTWQVS